MRKGLSQAPAHTGLHPVTLNYAHAHGVGKSRSCGTPLATLLIYIILYAMFKSVKWALLILTNIAMAPIGGLFALLVHGN